MTTTGTVTWLPDVSEICEEAYERCGIEMRDGYDAVTARRSLQVVMLELENKGLNLFSLDSETVTLVAGTAQYTMVSDTQDVIEGAIRTTNGPTTTDFVLERMTRSDYTQIPNKTTQARPLQFLVERLDSGVYVTFWPVPDSSQTYTFYYWRIRYLQDVGTPQNTLDMVRRYVPAIMSGLAYHLACKHPQQCDMNMRVMLKSRYDEDLSQAMDEDRDRASFYLVPAIGQTARTI